MQHPLGLGQANKKQSNVAIATAFRFRVRDDKEALGKEQKCKSAKKPSACSRVVMLHTDARRRAESRAAMCASLNSREHLMNQLDRAGANTHFSFSDGGR